MQARDISDNHLSFNGLWVVGFFGQGTHGEGSLLEYTYVGEILFAGVFASCHFFYQPTVKFLRCVVAC